MKTKLFKTSIALFFLLLFTGGKAFGQHLLSHDHDEEIVECEVCDKALLDQFSPFDNSSQHDEIVEIPKEFIDANINFYSSRILTNDLDTALFSRPPPVLN